MIAVTVEEQASCHARTSQIRENLAAARRIPNECLLCDNSWRAALVATTVATPAEMARKRAESPRLPLASPLLAAAHEQHRRAEERFLMDTQSRWLAQRHYSDLPSEAEQALRQAGLSWHREAEAEAHLSRAARLAPGHLAVLVAHYRYHFYKHHHREAARWAKDCLESVAAELGIPQDFAQVEASHADFQGDDALVRFWLFGMQAYGYVLLRLGEQERGRAALQKVTALDLADRTKTRVLLEVIEGAGREEA